jgi:predicted transporter
VLDKEEMKNFIFSLPVALQVGLASGVILFVMLNVIIIYCESLESSKKMSPKDWMWGELMLFGISFVFYPLFMWFIWSVQYLITS